MLQIGSVAEKKSLCFLFCSLSFDTHTTYTKSLELQNNVSNDQSTHSAEPVEATELRWNFVANYFAYSPHWDGMNHAVHSTWFGILGETGVVGLVVFVTLLSTLVKGLISRREKIAKLEAWAHANNQTFHPIIEPYWYALLAGFASFCISGTFLTQGFTWPFYILMALTVGFIKYIDEECEAKNIK